MTLPIDKKLFPLDKNYILKEAQSDLQGKLLIYMIETVKLTYLKDFNPLGLEDDTILKIKASVTKDTGNLTELYENMAGIYRYKFGNNQLEFLFDGTNHFDKYKMDWEAGFKDWLNEFCKNPNFLKGVLEATVFYPESKKSHLACNRLKAFIYQQFHLKVYKYKGIVKMNIA